MQVNYNFSVLSLQRLLNILEERHKHHFRDNQCRVGRLICFFWNIVDTCPGKFWSGGWSYGVGSKQNILSDLWQSWWTDSCCEVYYQT